MDTAGDTVGAVAGGDDNVDIAAGGGGGGSVVAVDDTAVVAVDNTAVEKDILPDDGSVACSQTPKTRFRLKYRARMIK